MLWPPLRTAIRALPLCIGLLALGAGCASHAHRSFGTAIAPPAALKAAGAPALPPGCTPLLVGAVTLPKGVDAAAIPVEALRRGLRDALERGGAALDVDLAERRPQDEGVLVETRLTKVSLRRLEERESLLGALTAWAFLGCLADWYHDRDYALELEATFSVRDLRGGERFDVPGGRGAAEDSLSLWERRVGWGAFAATVVWIPATVFDSTPEAVVGALAAEAFRAPAAQLAASLRELSLAWRVEPPVIHALPEMSVELLSPAAGALQDDPRAEVTVRFTVTTREAADKTWRVEAAGRQIYLEGVREEVKLGWIDLAVEPLIVRVSEGGNPSAQVLELSAVPRLVRAPKARLAAAGVAPTPATTDAR